MGRAGYVNDEIGSAIIAARLVRDVMRLAFLMEKVYPPYAKWLGTAFGQLQSVTMLEPVLRNTLYARSWRDREEHLCAAYEILGKMHNALNITEPLPATVSQFWGRPFKVIHGERFAGSIKENITDPRVKLFLKKGFIGSIDLFSDNTDILDSTQCCLRLRTLCE